MSVSSQYRKIDAVAAQGSKSYSSFRGSTAVVAVAAAAGAGLMLSGPGPGGEGRCAAAIRPKRIGLCSLNKKKKSILAYKENEAH